MTSMQKLNGPTNVKRLLLLIAIALSFGIAAQAQQMPDTGGALTQILVGTNVPLCTFGTAGPLCANEGTAPDPISGAAALYPDSTAHEWEGCTNGAGPPCGIMVRAAGSVNQTSKTAAITTATLCAASAGACNVAGQYHVSLNIWGSGTACSSVTAGKLVVTISWTDENGTAHSAFPPPMYDIKNTTINFTGTVNLGTTLATEGGMSDLTISTNGSVIQYAVAYTACTTGTDTYNVRGTVTRLQ